jgi:hypothetical protein
LEATRSEESVFLQGGDSPFDPKATSRHPESANPVVGPFSQRLPARIA